jgi:CRP-like cAMP-binding protein
MLIDEKLLYQYGAERMFYKSGDIIFNEGMSPFFYYQIVVGKVKLNHYNEEGKESIQNIILPGQSIGECLLFLDNFYPMNAEVLEETVLLKLSKTKFLELLNFYPYLYKDLSLFMSGELYHRFLLMQNNSINSPIIRLKGLLDYLKNETLEAAIPFSFKIDLTRQQLAGLTGMCVETVIRTVKLMESQNMLRLKKGKILY